MPPRSVNLMALETRFSTICLNARGSPVMTGRSSGARVTRSMPFSRAFSASRLQQLISAARGANGSGAISKLPDSIFDMSRMPLTTDNRCWPESLISCAYSLRRAASSISASSCTIISEKPMMALSGVRSSWLMVARKRVLAASACSAAVRARSSACSWILRSVTSRITATTSASALPRLRRLLERPATHLDPDEIDRDVLTALAAARRIAPETEFDAARLAAARGVRQRGEIGRTIGDMDAVEQAVAEQPRDRRAEHRLHRRRNELHRAVAAWREITSLMLRASRR